MKNTSKIAFFSLYRSFRENLISDPMVSLGNLLELPVLFKRLGFRLLAASFPSATKFKNRLRQLHNFGQGILKMRKHHGGTYTVKYLKASQLAISKAIAGTRFKSLRELEDLHPLPRLTTSGLPQVIPLGDRRAIMSGSASVIRWWQTLFGVYRILRIPGILKLSTIEAPYSGDQDFLNKASVNLGDLFLKFKKVRSWKPVPASKGLLFLETSSPNFVASWLGIVHDAILLEHLGLAEVLIDIMVATRGLDSRLQGMFENILHLASLREGAISGNYSGSPLKEAARPAFPESVEAGIPFGRGGQLSLKEEAAGKIRVFAMVDVWTQSVLKPVHDSVSMILKSLPNDGTFDQEGAVKRCFLKAKSTGLSYGFDLSAATDRLPILLQKSLISTLYSSKEFGDNWGELLVGRAYQLETASYKYSVGQPMGALSSFNMLALTHHMIVQYCAARTLVLERGSWWDGYELLGDDIVIFDSAVSVSYLSFMRSIGMEINEKKSVVAKNESFEFAKVTGHYGHNVSAISWRMFISQNSFIGRANIAFSLLRKGIGRPGSWLKNILRHRRYSQGDFNLSLVAVWSMFAGSRFVDLSSFLRSIISRTRGWAKPYLQVEEDLRRDYILNLIDTCLKGKDLGLDQSKQLESIWRQMWPYLKAHKLEGIRRTWNLYFESHAVTSGHISGLTDRICAMIAAGFTNAPLGAPKEICSVHECFDNLWWDIHDHLEDEFMRSRRILDRAGLQMIDEITLEELEKASLEGGSIKSLLQLPDRATAKLMDSGAPEARFSTAVDVLSWISAGRKARLKRVPMNWVARSWDVWYH